MIVPKPVVKNIMTDRISAIAPKLGEPSLISINPVEVRNRTSAARQARAMTRSGVVPSEMPLAVRR